MNSNHRFGIAVLLVVAAGVASLLAAPSLPDELVVNWDSAGEPSGTMPATQAIALVPGLMAGLLVLFAIIPRIDPLSENIAAFRPEYDWFVVVMTAFLFGIHAGVLLFNLGYEFPFIQALIPGFALVFYLKCRRARPLPQGVVRESKILVIPKIEDFRTTTQAEGRVALTSTPFSFAHQNAPRSEDAVGRGYARRHRLTNNPNPNI